MKKDWTNLLVFTMSFVIDNKTSITQTMIKHQMFPGNTCRCSILMDKCYHGGVAHTLKVHIAVYEKGTNMKLDEFEMGQGMFQKFMQNIHSPQISRSIN